MSEANLPYYRPDIGDAEIAAVTASLRNGWLTTGPCAAELESAFARTAGIRHAIALSSCTAALHVALAAMDVGPGDEVVMPSLTFVAGAQCTRELGATPVFADVDQHTLSVSVETIDAVVTPKTKAIIPMPYAGRPMNAAAIVEYAHARGILVLEDAAHAAGMLDRGHWSGTLSDAAAYSFYATKNVTTAEGGLLLTNDANLAERARRLSLHGMSRDAWSRYSAKGAWRYDVLEPGFKYNLPDPLAAIGVAQLNRLGAMLARREEIAARYTERIGKLPGVTLQARPENGGDRHSWCMFVMKLDAQEAGITRDALIETLARHGIGSSVHYIPTHHFSGYRSLAHAPLPNTEAVWQRLISLPLYSTMSDTDVERVIGVLAGAIVGSSSPGEAYVAS